jgi:hypothetical protein
MIVVNKIYTKVVIGKIRKMSCFLRVLSVIKTNISS